MLYSKYSFLNGQPCMRPQKEMKLLRPTAHKNARKASFPIYRIGSEKMCAATMLL